jgi:hypothetical protein
MPTYTVSALYCPTGKVYRYRANNWESAHRLAIAFRETRGYGSEHSDWVDIRSAEDRPADGGGEAA